ncbi:hypothetical protein [Stutzerimonas nitrititolerans]|uniref:hypothetical protein n=1 Tax=Stutzerimonas nitrititolerans TaxID=2482751 RepID=UPI00289B2636|nr:hypothetical protein [Stutzerimonas nitrititolerans]
MPWYSTGTVAVTANSATVTGTGTAFSANARVGDAFRGPDGRWYEITNIASATVLSIRPNYQGTTASGQAYAIAPMQGYVKESADRLRQLTDLIGGSPWLQATTPEEARESLGATEIGSAIFTAISQQAAREAIGAEDASRLTVGLLDAARVPATLAADKAFRRGNILGTVSQSAGLPTGAIIERGSNANGEYVRFADGTQICLKKIPANVAISTAGSSLYWTGEPIPGGQFAASFTEEPSVTMFVTGNFPSMLQGGEGLTATAFGIFYQYSDAMRPLSSYIYHLRAEGRWY